LNYYDNAGKRKGKTFAATAACASATSCSTCAASMCAGSAQGGVALDAGLRVKSLPDVLVRHMRQLEELVSVGIK
jgi:positive regulator of sigma E activity